MGELTKAEDAAERQRRNQEVKQVTSTLEGILQDMPGASIASVIQAAVPDHLIIGEVDDQDLSKYLMDWWKRH